jgi:hypothetical protein
MTQTSLDWAIVAAHFALSCSTVSTQLTWALLALSLACSFALLRTLRERSDP